MTRVRPWHAAVEVLSHRVRHGWRAPAGLQLPAGLRTGAWDDLAPAPPAERRSAAARGVSDLGSPAYAAHLLAVSAVERRCRGLLGHLTGEPC